MRVLTSKKISAQGLESNIKTFLGLAILSEANYSAIILQKGKSDRHREQGQFADRLKTSLENAAKENANFLSSTYDSDFGKITVSISATRDSAHTIQVKTDDRRRSSVTGVLHIMTITVNFEDMGKEVRVHLGADDSSKAFSRDNIHEIGGLAAAIKEYLPPSSS